MDDTPQKSVPTLEDVAKAAGVSTATVSRCLNSPDLVVAKTRDRVMSAVDRLGYTPNFAARVMAAKRSFTIGAIIPTMENAVFAQGLQAFQETLHAHGYMLLVSSSAYRPDLERAQIRTLASRGVDGLLLIGTDRDPEVYAYLQQQSIPTVLAWTYGPDMPLPSVGFDNFAAMDQLVQDVLSAGHRDIAMIAAQTMGNDRARARVEAVQTAVLAAGCSLRVVETPYGIDTGAAAFAELMATGQRPTVVMCGSDVLAVGALRQAREMGLCVPGDVSLTGFDDMDLAQIVSPALTTVRVPHWDMGCAAAEQLVGRLSQDRPMTSVKLPTTVVRRASLGVRPVR